LDDSIASVGVYEVRHYPRDPDRLVVVFAGAGKKGAKSRTEEFRNSLWETGVSLCFVRDLEFCWYSHETARLLFDHLDQLSSTYPNVGALGHSMGASGAIICAAHCRRLERVLAFSPQFSMVDPFIRFDERFGDIGDFASKQRRPAFHAPGRSRRIVVLYGTQDWPDLVHAGAYAIHGYDLGFVEGANHMVPRDLKIAPEGNLLVELTAKFADFSAPFGYDAVKSVLGDRLSRHLTSHAPRFDTDHRPRDKASD